MATDSGPAGQGSPADPAAALAERLFHDMVGALELFTVYLGDRLGLYRALDTDGPATSAELAGRTGAAERYVREWLEHHAASGLLDVDDPAAGPLARRYRLPPVHVPVLADPDDVRYRACSGVEIVHDRLRRPPPARVADLACGPGWSSIAIAQAYPLVRVDGFDLDPDVIAAARRNAAQAGVPGRVTFAVTDASGPGMSGRFDLVTIFEGLHDMSRPADALRAARGMLGKSGSVIIADELVEDEFTVPASDLESQGR